MRRVGRCNIRLLKTLSEHAGGFATESMRNQFLGELGLLVSEVRELRKRSERDAETIRCLRDQLFLKGVDPSYRADPCNPISEGGGGSGH